MNQFYSVTLILAGLLLVFKVAKENKIFILAGAYFCALGAWRMADTFVQEDLFAGIYGIGVKVVTVLVLCAMIIYFAMRYIKEYKTGKTEKKEPEFKEKEGD